MKNRIGEVYTFTDGTTMEIIEYYSAKNITIKFNDNTIVTNVKYYRFTDGAIKNNNIPSVYGVGYIGYGKYGSEINGVSNIIYSKWNKMLQRCYSDKYHIGKPTYIGCSVHPDWHNFQNFADWAVKNYVEGFELDKDILVKVNKVYSAETCCFVPREINSLFIRSKNIKRELPTGVYRHKDKFRSYINIKGKLELIGYYFTIEDAFLSYKIKKELNVKISAIHYKNKISIRCYNALMDWKIDIND